MTSPQRRSTLHVSVLVTASTPRGRSTFVDRYTRAVAFFLECTAATIRLIHRARHKAAWGWGDPMLGGLSPAGGPGDCMLRLARAYCGWGDPMLRQCYVAGPRGVCRVLVACRGAAALPSRVCPVQNTRVHAFHTDGSGDRVELARLAWPPYVMHTGMRVRIGLIGLS